MSFNALAKDKDYYNPNPRKNAHRIADKTFVVIDESLVRRLEIDEDTWFEEELLEKGIFLKIIRPISSGVSQK